MDVKKAAELFIEKIKKDYPEDVSLVVMMGSHLFQATHAKSDLDMYYIPKTKRGYQLAFVCIIDGIGFDFWPISWERIERISNLEERIQSIVAQGEILYYQSEEDKERFLSYRNTILTKSPSDYQNVLRRKMPLLYKEYVLLQKANQEDMIRRNAIHLLNQACEILALLNQTFIARGRGYLRKEIHQMNFVPSTFDLFMTSVYERKSKETILSYFDVMLSEIETKYELFQNQPSEPIQELFNGFYEELINFYNKMNRAIDTHDEALLYHAYVEIEDELKWIFTGYESLYQSLPKLDELSNITSWEERRAFVKMHQSSFEQFLHDHEVPLRTFKDMDELKEYLDTL